MAFWVTANLQRVVYRMKFPRCINGAAMQLHRFFLDRYQREGGLSCTNRRYGETWARSYEPNLTHQSNEWKHPGSPHPKKMRLTQCAVKVTFIVTYDIDGEGRFKGPAAVGSPKLEGAHRQPSEINIISKNRLIFPLKSSSLKI